MFFEQTLLSHRTDTNFSRNPYLVFEHIQIFQEALYSPRAPTIFQKTLSSPRTHTIFQETPMPRTHRHFPGRYPLSNRYFVNRSRWLLSFILDSISNVCIQFSNNRQLLNKDFQVSTDQIPISITHIFNIIHTWFYLLTEAATETVFENICSFLPGATFL